jgi:hypothetical protein
MARQASLLVADEIFYNLHGKAVLQGIYNADLVLNAQSAVVPQLIFFFMAESDLNDPFRSVVVEVTLPGNEPIRQQVPIALPLQTSAPPGRTKIFVKWPLLIGGPTLRPGHIEAKFIHEGGEIIVGAPWIVLRSAPSDAPTAH